MSEKISQLTWIQTATRFRYVLPVLAELARDQGCKFVTLMRCLGASDRAIRQALDYLMDLNWVMKNPGYGHPMRPEYVLTDIGQNSGSSALRIWDELGQWSERDLALERWPLAVCRLMAMGESRFGQIRAQLPEISPRALAISLKRIEESGIATRKVGDGHPPTVSYEPTKWGKELALLLESK